MIITQEAERRFIKFYRHCLPCYPNLIIFHMRLRHHLYSKVTVPELDKVTNPKYGEYILYIGTVLTNQKSLLALLLYTLLLTKIVTHITKQLNLLVS